MKRESCDHIIVSGGSAGCAPANRLTADERTRVLVLDAGHRHSRLDYPVRVPAAVRFVMGNRFYDWRYRPEPEPGLGGRRTEHYRGKLVGGCSSINGMNANLYALGHDDRRKGRGPDSSRGAARSRVRRFHDQVLHPRGHAERPPS